MSIQIDNTGIGAGPFLTMAIGVMKGFTLADIDANYIACVISGDNEVGMGTAGSRLFGKIVWVSTDLIPGTSQPTLCAVQARGVARFPYSTPTPVVNQMVEVDGAGKVRLASGSHSMHGQVIAVNTTDTTCDVWLG